MVDSKINNAARWEKGLTPMMLEPACGRFFSRKYQKGIARKRAPTYFAAIDAAVDSDRRGALLDLGYVLILQTRSGHVHETI